MSKEKESSSGREVRDTRIMIRTNLDKVVSDPEVRKRAEDLIVEDVRDCAQEVAESLFDNEDDEGTFPLTLLVESAADRVRSVLVARGLETTDEFGDVAERWVRTAGVAAVTRAIENVVHASTLGKDGDRDYTDDSWRVRGVGVGNVLCEAVISIKNVDRDATLIGIDGMEFFFSIGSIIEVTQVCDPIVDVDEIATSAIEKAADEVRARRGQVAASTN